MSYHIPYKNKIYTGIWYDRSVVQSMGGGRIGGPVPPLKLFQNVLKLRLNLKIQYLLLGSIQVSTHVPQKPLSVRSLRPWEAGTLSM